MNPQCDTYMKQGKYSVRCVRTGICSRLWCYHIKAGIEPLPAIPRLSLITHVEGRISQMEAGKHFGHFLAENVLKAAKKKSLHPLLGLLVRRACWEPSSLAAACIHPPALCCQAAAGLWANSTVSHCPVWVIPCGCSSSQSLSTAENPRQKCVQ